MSVLPDARAFANRSLAVLPLWGPVGPDNKLVCACGRLCGKNAAKHPHRLAPNGLHSATTDSGIIKHWFGYQAPDANLGVCTDRLIVVDADKRHGGDETLAALEREYGELPLTWRVLTGGGGEHVIFACPDGVEIASSNAHQNPVLRPGIDIRARGGYIVAPPSRHINGRHYTWSVDHHPKDVPLALPPDWLIERLIASNKSAAASAGADNAAQHEPHPSDLWAKLTRQPITEYRDMAATQIAGHLFCHACDFQLVRGLMHAWNSAWCQPPLGYHELDKIINRIAARQAARWERELER
jgi:hypothetical protein